jgi:hypothetical protein
MKPFLAALTACFVTTSCIAATDALKPLVPSDAESIDFRAMGNGSQASYSVHRKYPGAGISSEGVDNFRKNGWSYCAKQRESEWSSFLTQPGANSERVYQRLSYLQKGDRLITIGQRYYGRSAEELQPGAAGSPRDDLQHVVIVEGTLSAEAIKDLLESSRVSCEGGK